MSSDLLLRILDLSGVWAFAVSGSLTALNRRMDIIGVLIVGFVTAFGGGSLRDMLISRPVFWLNDLNYIYILFVSCILAVVFRNYLGYLRKTLFLFDTIGLGVYTMIGINIGMNYGYHPILCIALGVLTACFGGVIRDILCNEVPLIFHREIYATICIVGGAIYIVLLKVFDIDNFICTISGLIFIISVRLIVVKYHLSFPPLTMKNNSPNG